MHLSGATSTSPYIRVPRAMSPGNIALGLLILTSGYVVVEPAPYELIFVAVLGGWLLFGLRIPAAIMPLLILLTLFNFGGVLSIFQMEDFKMGAMYVAVSFFLALTSVFFAIIIGEDHRRLGLIFKLYVAAAVFSTALGLFGYFGVPGFGAFTLYSRSAGGFQDPNVYGPFLVTPILFLIYQIINQRLQIAALLLPVAGFLLLGLLLAFSRAAWGLTAICAGIFYFMLVVNERNQLKRLRYISLAAIGFVLLVVALIGVLQIEAVSSLFSERVKVVQDYDGGRLGRFARHALGFQLALEKPFGIGQLQFQEFFVEATHNNYLKALMEYGWLGFVCWMLINFGTLAITFKMMFRPRPWQVYLQIAWIIFFGHQIVGIVIDTDHWRHFYLLLGILWGCRLLEKKWQKGNDPQFADLPSISRLEINTSARFGTDGNQSVRHLEPVLPPLPAMARPAWSIQS